MMMSPDELSATLSADPIGRSVAGGARMPGGPGRARGARSPTRLGAGRDRQVRLADPGQGAEEAHPPGHGADALVWGEHDRLVSPVYAEEFAARIPGRGWRSSPAQATCRSGSSQTVKPLVLDFLGA